MNEIAIIMPDDVAEEKVKALRALGADVQRVRPASIVDKKQVRPSVSGYRVVQWLIWFAVCCKGLSLIQDMLIADDASLCFSLEPSQTTRS